MYHHYSNHFNKEVTIIHPGEYFASEDDIVISTVLGSCVAVAFFDPVKKSGGLNHFMLPSTVRKESFYSTMSGKYGMYAMELLINKMIKLGCKKDRLVAKVFGGASVLERKDGTKNAIPESNVDFAFEYLKAEQIEIQSYDVGGTQARKVFFFPQTAKILLKRITGVYLKPIEEEEESYLRKIKKESQKGGEPTLF
ncbi:MAG: chemotaxis protein CheD [Spirochaetia bacterium]